MAKQLSVNEVARHLRVDPRDVIRVLLGQAGVSDDMRIQIHGALRSAGFILLSEQSANTLVVFAPTLGSSEYIGLVLDGIRDTAQKLGYTVSISVSSYVETRPAQYEILRDEAVVGSILLYPDHFEHLYSQITQSGKPYVLIDYTGDLDISQIPLVMVKNREPIVRAVEHLASLGHQRIGFITGRRGGGATRARWQGYRDGLKAAGLPYDESLVYEGDWEAISGREAAQVLLTLPMPPSAIVASNDMMAFGVMEVAPELGYEVGENLSVTGFDDVPMASTVRPRLTTVRQPTRAIGETAVDMVTALIEAGDVNPIHVHLDTEFVIRESTAPYRL